MATSPLDDAGSFDLAETTPAGGSSAPSIRRDAGLGFYVAFTFAVLGGAMSSVVPGLLTFSLKATAIDPGNATTILSRTVTVTSVFLVVGSPLVGRLSDRTVSRFGRRRPFLLVGALLVGLGAVGFMAAGTVAMVLITASIGMIGSVMITVTCMATIPDHIPPDRRGISSSIIGLSFPAGAVVGLWLAQLFPTELNGMILLPAGIAVVSAIVFVFVLDDRPVTSAERPPFGWRQFLSTFWVNPRRHPDFACAWLSRLLLFFSVATVQAYQAFYLIYELGYTPLNVARAVFLGTLVLTGVAVVVAPVLSKVSDRIGRRKPFVACAAVVFAVGVTLAVYSHSFSAFLVAMAVMGLGQGVYSAVDIALATQVLPDSSDAAKDMGLMNLASSVPSLLVTAIGPVVLAIGATALHPNNFSALFAMGAVAGVLGAVLILPIKSVR